MKKYLVTVGGLVLLSSGLANAAMYLYDDFNSATKSDTLWTKTTSGAGTATWTGGYAALDMTSNTANKQSVIQANQMVNLANATATYQVTWDMYVATPSTTSGSGYLNGLSLGTSATYLQAGQRGYAGGNSSWYLYFNNAPISGFGYGGTARKIWLHYDLAVTSTSQTLKVYLQNAAYNSDPTKYVSLATALWTATTTNVTLPTATDLQLRFWGNAPYAVDTATSTRDLIDVDNVFTSVAVPEPASLLLAILGGAVVCLGRKGRRNAGHKAA